jgi:tetratricopeptide (TPR) repeat protein
MGLVDRRRAETIMHNVAKALPSLLLIFTTGAFAASTADWSRCIFHSDVIGPGIEACTRIIQAGGVETRLLVVAYVSRGIEYEPGDHYDRAIADFTKAIELDPQDPMAYDRRGGAYYRKGDYGHAIVDYNKVRELNPHYTNVFFNLGISHKASGAFDFAIGYLTAAINVNPKDGGAYWMRGESYQAKRELNWAVADFNKALELGGDDRDFARSAYYDLHGCSSLDYAIANDPLCIQPVSLR